MPALNGLPKENARQCLLDEDKGSIYVAAVRFCSRQRDSVALTHRFNLPCLREAGLTLRRGIARIVCSNSDG